MDQKACANALLETVTSIKVPNSRTVQLGVRQRDAISMELSRKSYWHLSKTLAGNSGLKMHILRRPDSSPCVSYGGKFIIRLWPDRHLIQIRFV